MCSKRRRKDSHSKSPAYWESMVNKYEGRNSELEEKESELQDRLELLEITAPQRVLYNMLKMMKNETKNEFQSHSPHLIRSRESFTRRKEETYKSGRSEKYYKEDDRERSRSPLQTTSLGGDQKRRKKSSNYETKMILQQYIRTLEEEKGELMRHKHCMENMIKDLEMQLLEIKNGGGNCQENNNDEDVVSVGSMEFELMKTVQELKERGTEMSKRIETMEKREAGYLETLKQADAICAEMEMGYKQHCYLAEQNEAEMRDRLQRLKRREESERRCCFGDSIHQGRSTKYAKQDHQESRKYWSMFDPICSMLNRWH